MFLLYTPIGGNKFNKRDFSYLWITNGVKMNQEQRTINDKIESKDFLKQSLVKVLTVGALVGFGINGQRTFNRLDYQERELSRNLVYANQIVQIDNNIENLEYKIRYGPSSFGRIPDEDLSFMINHYKTLRGELKSGKDSLLSIPIYISEYNHYKKVKLEIEQGRKDMNNTILPIVFGTTFINLLLMGLISKNKKED